MGAQFSHRLRSEAHQALTASHLVALSRKRVIYDCDMYDGECSYFQVDSVMAITDIHGREPLYTHGN